MQESRDIRNITESVKQAYARAAPYLSDHPSILEFILAHQDLDGERLCALIEERLKNEKTPRSTDLRILKNALAKEK